MWRFFPPILKYLIGHTCLRKEINFLFGMPSQKSAYQAAPDRCWNTSSLAPQKTIFSVGLFSIFRKANIDAAKPQLLQTDLQNFWQISISCFAPLKLSMYNAHHPNSNGSVRIWGKKHKLFEMEIECEFAAEMIVRAVSWLVWFHVNVWQKTLYWKTFWCDLFVLMYFQCWNVVSSPWNTKCVVITTMGGQATTICWAYKLPRLWEKEGWKRISPNVWLMEKLVQFHRLNFPPGGISKTYFYSLFTNWGRPNGCFPIWIIFLLISEKKENKVSLSSVEEQKQKEALRFQDIYRESASK